MAASADWVDAAKAHRRQLCSNERAQGRKLVKLAEKRTKAREDKKDEEAHRLNEQIVQGDVVINAIHDEIEAVDKWLLHSWSDVSGEKPAFLEGLV